MFDRLDYEESDDSAISKRRHKHSNIDYLDVYVYSFDQSLNLDTDESYTLTVGFDTTVCPCTCTVCHGTCQERGPQDPVHKQISNYENSCMHQSAGD